MNRGGLFLERGGGTSARRDIEVLPRISGQAGSGAEGFPGVSRTAGSKKEQAGHLRSKAKSDKPTCILVYCDETLGQVPHSRACPAVWRYKFFLPSQKIYKKLSLIMVHYTSGTVKERKNLNGFRPLVSVGRPIFF